jgi:hypothetical protein
LESDEFEARKNCGTEMKLTLYARQLLEKIENRTPEEKRRAYKREWQRRQRAAAGVAATWAADRVTNGR